jgi:hypothetical protein
MRISPTRCFEVRCASCIEAGCGLLLAVLRRSRILVRDSWHSSFEEKVVHPNVLRPELNVDCTVPLAEVLMWL